MTVPVVATDEATHPRVLPEAILRPIPTPADEKRMRRKKKAPVNFKLNKLLVRAESSDEVLTIIGENLHDFNIVNIGTALYRLALVGGSLSPSSRDSIRIDPRFSDLISEIVETLQGDTNSQTLQQIVLAPKELSNIIWAATKLGLSDDKLFDAVASHVIRHMVHFDSVNLSLTLWGFAKMSQNNPALFEAARPRVTALLSEFEPHRICNTVWAYAKTGNTDLELFRLIAEESLRKLHRFNHSNESMLLYSYALGHVHAPVLFRRAMAQQLPAIKSGEVQDPRSLSNLLWAVSELELWTEFRELYDVVTRSAIANIHRYSLTHMATIASAFAKADIRSDELFALMLTECENRPISDPSMIPDLVVLNDSYEKLSIDSGIVKQALDVVKAAEEQLETIETSEDRQVRVRNFVAELIGTSAIAGAVLIVAALVKIYFARV
jgi:hypothetical protein